ncbi:MAG: anti-sigma factor antagonist [Acidimicrobiales bacterium]
MRDLVAGARVRPRLGGSQIVFPGDSCLEGFVLTTSFLGNQVVLGVEGEVDLMTAPELAALLDAAIDRRQGSVVLDLGGVSFMDASGLRVIAEAIGRLGLRDEMLTIRSASANVARILDLVGLAGLVQIQRQAGSSHLGPEQLVTVAPEPPGIGLGGAELVLGAPLRKVTAIPAGDDVVDSALRLVVALARATVGGADGVSVSLKRYGQLSTVAASDETILAMDSDQYATGEGPCVDASMDGRWFHVESLETEKRWPAFIPRARSLGINAILSSPLLAADRPVGALNIYSRTTAAFAPRDQELASVFAAQASSILTHAGTDVTDGELANRLGEALRARELIAQAQGVLMQRDRIGEIDAFATLRRWSVATNRSLRELADAVVTSTWQPGPTEPLRDPLVDLVSEGAHHTGPEPSRG